MSLDHYVTLGRSGLRVSPLCLGTMTFGEEWGWGSTVAESEAILARYMERGGNFIDTANAYTKGHSEVDHRRLLRPHAGAARSRGDCHQVPVEPVSGRPQRRRRRPQVAGGGVRAVAAPAQDRLHRSLLDALLGSAHADRRDDAGAGRPGARRQGALRRLLGHPGLEGGAGADPGAVPRLGAAHRAADRVLADRAHRRRRAGADGAGARARHHAVVAAPRRRALRASTRARTPGR